MLEIALTLAAATGAGGAPARHPLLVLFNMTNWWELPWFLIGVVGQLAFFLRMFVQWVASERKKQSVVPPVFWWLSLVGSAFLLTYAVWRKDIVIAVGQSLGTFIYTRNLWFIKTHRERVEAESLLEGAAKREGDTGPVRVPRAERDQPTPDVVVKARDGAGTARSAGS